MAVVEMKKVRMSMMKEKSRKIPFEQLPNLPKPTFSPIDLGITHMDLGFTGKSVLAIE